jgi:predicted nucleic acid-binding protein
MILIDTNVLVALVLQKDELHDRAVRDLGRLARRELFVVPAVLAEACFLLELREQRARLGELLARMRARPVSEPPWPVVFSWLHRYAEHEPDWADACMVVLASEEPFRVWTYDAEFRAIWRRLDGSRVPLAGR